MEFTNKFNLQSKSLLDALTSDDYDLNDAPPNVVSVTRLIDAPIQEILNKRHKDEVVEDVSSRVWTLLGRSVHHVIEMSNLKSADRLTEERWYLLVPIGNVVKPVVWILNDGERIQNQDWYCEDDFYVSGKLDCFEDGILEDYKVSSSFAFTGKMKDAWGEQLNINAFALIMLGHEVRGLRIIGIIKNHDQHRADSDEKYPQIPLVELYFDLWNNEKALNFIVERSIAFLEQRALPDDMLKPCSPSNRWYRGGKYAVMKKGNKKAVSHGVFDETPEGKMAAEGMADSLGPNHYVESRPGTDLRCLDKRQFCNVQQWCPYFQKLYGKKAPTKEGW